MKRSLSFCSLFLLGGLLFLFPQCSSSPDLEQGYVLTIKDVSFADPDGSGGDVDLPTSPTCVQVSDARLSTLTLDILPTFSQLPQDVPPINIYLTGYRVDYTPISSVDKTNPGLRVTLPPYENNFPEPLRVGTIAGNTKTTLDMKGVISYFPAFKKRELWERIQARGVTNATLAEALYDISMTFFFKDSEGREFTRTLTFHVNVYDYTPCT